MESNRELTVSLEEVVTEYDGIFEIGQSIYADFIASSFSYISALDKAIKWIQNNINSVTNEENKASMESIKQDLDSGKSDIISIQDTIKEINKSVKKREDKTIIEGLINELKKQVNNKVYVKKTIDALTKALPSFEEDSKDVLNQIPDVIDKIKIQESNERMDQVLSKIDVSLDMNSDFNPEDVTELNAVILSYSKGMNETVKWIERKELYVPSEQKKKVSKIKKDLILAEKILTTIKTQVQEICSLDPKPKGTILGLKANIFFKLYASLTAGVVEQVKDLSV